MARLPPNKRRRMMLWAKQQGKCYYCQRKMVKRFKSGRSVTVDHYFPRCEGGRRTPDNLVGACYRCNTLKGDMLPWEFAAKYPDPRVMPEAWPLGGIEDMMSREKRRKAKREEKKRRKELIANLPSNDRKRERAGFNGKDMGYDNPATYSLAEAWPRD